MRNELAAGRIRLAKLGDILILDRAHISVSDTIWSAGFDWMTGEMNSLRDRHVKIVIVRKKLHLCQTKSAAGKHRPSEYGHHNATSKQHRYERMPARYPEDDLKSRKQCRLTSWQ